MLMVEFLRVILRSYLDSQVVPKKWIEFLELRKKNGSKTCSHICSSKDLVHFLRTTKLEPIPDKVTILFFSSPQYDLNSGSSKCLGWYGAAASERVPF